VDLELGGRTVVITGGSGGIGHGLVIGFAREGANVVSASRDVATGEKLAARAREQHCPGEVLAVATDVTDTASVAAMLDRAHERFGAVDVLVNNAGGVARHCAFEDLDEQTRRWELALNVDGVVNCTLAVAADMLSRGKGSVVNISSNSSLLGEAAHNIVHYGAAKGFVNSFTKSLAWEWGPQGCARQHHRPRLDRPASQRRDRGRQLLEPARFRGHARRHAGGARGRLAAQHEPSAHQAARSPGGHRQSRDVPGLGRGGLHHGTTDLGERRRLHAVTAPIQGNRR
jgi:NAD(P)-dependent dehydrogenase (short-subunit alcohol dehydrogenase family)